MQMGQKMPHIYGHLLLVLTLLVLNVNVLVTNVNGPHAPPFVGEDYFCERGAIPLFTAFNPKNPLWDGPVCKDDGNECCSRIKHPYFIKHLSIPTTNNIDLRVCSSLSDLSYALEIIELYVK